MSCRPRALRSSASITRARPAIALLLAHSRHHEAPPEMVGFRRVGRPERRVWVGEEAPQLVGPVAALAAAEPLEPAGQAEDDRQRHVGLECEREPLSPAAAVTVPAKAGRGGLTRGEPLGSRRREPDPDLGRACGVDSLTMRNEALAVAHPMKRACPRPRPQRLRRATNHGLRDFGGSRRSTPCAGTRAEPGGARRRRTSRRAARQIVEHFDRELESHF